MRTINMQKWSGLFSKVVWSVIVLSALYFVITRALHFLILTPESYGDYFWPRVNWVVPHVTCGILALLIGPTQFSRAIRSRHLKLHRLGGRVYLLSVLVGGTSGLVLAVTSSVSLAYAWGLGSLSFAWLLTSGMAFISILNRNVDQHKEWMIRSYVVTFAFVIFRLVADALQFFSIGTEGDRLTLMSWACWAIPLLIVEAVLQFRKISRSS